MTRSDPGHRWHGRRILSPAIVWNTVMPALGVGLILGAPIVPAIALATAVAIGLHAILSVARHAAERQRSMVVRHRRLPHGP